MTPATTVIAQTIANQILGRTGIAMIGAHTLVDHGNALSFKFKAGRKFNYCKVTLLADDSYKVEIGKIVKYKLTKVQTAEMHCEALRPFFERTTGLYLSL